MRLAGKRAIVTGAGSGIGRAAARLFAAEGAAVLAVDLPGRDLARQLENPKIAVLELDITDKGAPARIVAEAVERFGGLDILMNNAGIAINALAEVMAIEDWDRTCAVNVRAQFLLCQAAIPRLKESKAPRIINVASVMAEGTDYGLAAYCASKAGVAGLTRTLALELGKFGITANYIEPGAVHTGINDKTLSQPEIAAVWAKKAALRRLGTPEDIARGALFLASDDSAFVSGHGLRIDGGLMLRV